MPRPKGFTLIELLIVVALILIIAAIIVPCLTQSKISADEASAVTSIRAINTAEVSYEAMYGGYADTLANLGGAALWRITFFVASLAAVTYFCIRRRIARHTI